MKALKTRSGFVGQRALQPSAVARAVAVTLAGTVLLTAQSVVAADASQAMSTRDSFDDGRIHPWHIQGNIWLLAGEPNQTNVVVSVGNEGMLLVDTGVQEAAGKVVAAIQRLADEQSIDNPELRTIINTGPEADHIGGNGVLRKAGKMIVAGNFARDNAGLPPGADVIANEKALAFLVADNTAGGSGARQDLWPQDTVGTDVYNTMFNGEALQLFHPHEATSDGVEMVLFRHSDVLVTGDVVSMVSYPNIQVDRGGTIDGELVALNHILDWAVPSERAEGGTMIVPGHGRVCDQSDIVNYKNILTTIRNRVQEYKNEGKTLVQVLALKPSDDYDGRWASADGPASAKGFITAIYDTLPAKGPSFSMDTTTLVPATASIRGGKAY